MVTFPSLPSVLMDLTETDANVDTVAMAAWAAPTDPTSRRDFNIFEGG